MSNMSTENMSTEKLVKICRVCGDKAIGFNFNCMTCESCKSFFRRNALNFEKFSCRKDGDCHIDFVTRKCCTKCRLEKCFASGMRKELICRMLDTDCSSVSSLSNPNSLDGLSDSGESGISIDYVLERDIRHKISMCSMLFPEKYILNKASFPKRRKYSIELNNHEVDRIREIQNAHTLAAFYDENRLEIIGESNDLLHALNLAEIYIKKAIKFCKSFTAFKCLNQDDQLIILKSFFTELLIVRLAFVYNQERDGFPVIENENQNQAVLVKLDILYESKKKDNLYYCRQYSSNFHLELEEDVTLSDLILAQRLFKPRDNLSCPEFITYQHCSYQLLLNRYLEHKYKDVHRALIKMHKLTEILKGLNGPAKEIVEGIYCDFVDSSLLASGLNEVYK